jgi:predicted dehydrogenase
MKTVNLALVGISGYGHSYLAALLDAPADDGFELVGVVDPAPHRCRRIAEIRDRGFKIYPDLKHLYAENAVDLAMLATPIHHHSPQTCLALANGSSVLCEKPVGATVDDARQMLAAQRKSRGFAAIGYQWSYSRAIHALKRDILAGELGAPVRLKTLAFMPRSVEYYRRNDWAGRINTDDGTPVFDSPVNNSAAHYLHNMLYILGPRRDRSARPASVQAELYRANDIENYDTAAVRCRTDAGAEITFYTTHAVPIGLGPLVHYEFERATVYYEAESRAGFVARFRDGSIRRYGDPNVDRNLKIWQSIEAVRTRHALPCGIHAATSHAICVAAAQLSMPQVQDFPAPLVTVETLGGQPIRCVTGLAAALVQCYDQAMLPSEHHGLPWSVSGKLIDLSAPRWSIDGEAGIEHEIVEPADPVAARG